MIPDPLLQPDSCVTLKEAADRLSEAFKKPLAEADVLRLALSGTLTLSVYFPAGVVADCWDSPETVDEGNPPDYWADWGYPPVATEPQAIDGVWDIPIVLPGSLEVYRRFQELRSQPLVSADRRVGAVVERPGINCRVRAQQLQTPSPPSILPVEATFVIREDVLNQFTAGHCTPPTNTAAIVEKSLTEKERESLSIIIVSLAKLAAIDEGMSSKAAGQIVATASKLGFEISENNVAGKLKAALKKLGLGDKRPSD